MRALFLTYRISATLIAAWLVPAVLLVVEATSRAGHVPHYEDHTVGPNGVDTVLLNIEIAGILLGLVAGLVWLGLFAWFGFAIKMPGLLKSAWLYHLLVLTGVLGLWLVAGRHNPLGSTLEWILD
ncbi:MAG: hypothetical protein ACRYFX_01310 [Janthinobacterium lividum]